MLPPADDLDRLQRLFTVPSHGLGRYVRRARVLWAQRLTASRQHLGSPKMDQAGREAGVAEVLGLVREKRLPSGGTGDRLIARADSIQRATASSFFPAVFRHEPLGSPSSQLAIYPALRHCLSSGGKVWNRPKAVLNGLLMEGVRIFYTAPASEWAGTAVVDPAQTKQQRSTEWKGCYHFPKQSDLWTPPLMLDGRC